MKYCYSSGMDWYLDQTGYLYSESITSQMVLSMIWISVVGIHDDMDDTVQEIYLYLT